MPNCDTANLTKNRTRGWTMSSRFGWVVSAVFAYALVLSMLYGVPALRPAGDVLWRIAHGVAYAALGAVLLGALARNFPHAGAHVWRLSALVLGALAAGLGLWLTQPPQLSAASLDAWVAAVLGLAIVTTMPRWLPNAVVLRWLAIERRQTSRD
jgi:hypothetical protein